MIRLHHVAIAVEEFDQYVDLFVNLGLRIQRKTGEMPSRQLWFEEGIQLKESRGVKKGSNIDHIALGTDNSADIISTAIENGCTLIKGKDNWFSLPNGVSIELMEDQSI